MAEVRRKPPALFDRTLGEWQPTPQYIPFPEFQEPPLPANPVPPIRIRLLSELEVEFPHVQPKYQRFPYFEQPASPVIAYRYGQDVLARPEAFIIPRHLPFPYFEQPGLPHDPEDRHSIYFIDETKAFVAPRFLPFPYRPEAPPPPIPDMDWTEEAIQSQSRWYGQSFAYDEGKWLPLVPDPPLPAGWEGDYGRLFEWIREQGARILYTVPDELGILVVVETPLGDASGWYFYKHSQQ